MMLLVVIVPPRNSQKHVYHHHIPIQQSNRVETEKNMEYFSESTENSPLKITKSVTSLFLCSSGILCNCENGKKGMRGFGLVSFSCVDIEPKQAPFGLLRPLSLSKAVVDLHA